jgi:hypothetical protein
VFFTLMLGLISYQLLRACDFEHALFGFRYCQRAASAPQIANSSERERERSLTRRLHEAELRTAQLPVCTTKPQPKTNPDPEKRPEPEQREPIVAPKPPPEVLKIPAKIEDLKGCWQSDRGDLDIVTDDEKGELIGHVRICLCFGSNGKGEARYLYTDGDRCVGTLNARLEAGRLSMRQSRAGCRVHNFIVPNEIVCTQSNESAASCNKLSLGKMRRRVEDEKYHKVDNSQCEWRG